MPILTLTDDEQAYVCRKGYHALNVQAVVAPDLRYQRKCYVYTKIRECVSDILLRIVLNILITYHSIQTDTKDLPKWMSGSSRWRSLINFELDISMLYS